jgi:hypothetical protein
MTTCLSNIPYGQSCYGTISLRNEACNHILKQKEQKKEEKKTQFMSTTTDASADSDAKAQRLADLRAKLAQSKADNRMVVSAEYKSSVAKQASSATGQPPERHAYLKEQLAEKKRLRHEWTTEASAADAEEWADRQRKKRKTHVEGADLLTSSLSYASYERKSADKDAQSWSSERKGAAAIKGGQGETAEDVNRLLGNLRQQESSRANFSRQRKASPHEEVTAVNDGNQRFNKRLDRAYSSVAQSIKDDFDRGTAL